MSLDTQTTGAGHTCRKVLPCSRIVSWEGHSNRDLVSFCMPSNGHIHLSPCLSAALRLCCDCVLQALWTCMPLVLSVGITLTRPPHIQYRIRLFLSFYLVGSSVCRNPSERGEEVSDVPSRAGQTQLRHSQELPRVPQHLQFPDWKEETGTEDSQEEDERGPGQGLSFAPRRGFGTPPYML